MKVLLLVLLVAVAAHAAPSTPDVTVPPADTPAPVDTTKPAPVDDTKPAPVDATKPAPVDATKPAPVDATKPAPVDATKPADIPVSTEAPARADAVVTGACHCAAFRKEDYVEVDLIGNKTMSFTVECNENGYKECRDMCVALAQANKLKAPKKTCEILKDITVGFRPSLFSRGCDSTQWSYSGHKYEEDICCKEGLPTPCKA